jgi:condensin complex subunit 2
VYTQKINQKNSWSLDLIDHIDDVLQSNFNSEEGSGVGNFQAASCTLDASVKIYSYRVDSIHNETYRVLGDLSLTRNGKKSKRAHPSLVVYVMNVCIM